MHYGHSPDKARIFANQANALIDRAGLPRRPDIYELFYVYVSAHLPEVVRALDKIFAKNVMPNEQDCEEIFKLHVSGSIHENAMLQASEKVESTIADVKQIVNAMQEATGEYGDSLTGLSDNLAKATKLEDVAALVKTMMADTAAIVSKNKELENQLERSAEAIDTMKAEMDNVRREALTDGLTGLANRKFFDRKIDELHRKFTDDGETFCLLVMDIDHFKSFNDTYGHQVGDRVLKLLGAVLEHHTTERIFPARFGGEEFVVLATGVSLESATHIAESIRTQLAEKEVVNKTTGERLGVVTISIGVAEIMAGESANHLIERTDKALYAAKHAGRNRVITDNGVKAA